MAKLKITNGNDEVSVVNGKMTFKIGKAINQITGEEYMACIGSMATHKYFEEIKSIESDRFFLENIEVLEETFGTNDFNILYEFEVHNEGWNIKEDYLSEITIELIEEKEYKDDEGDYYLQVEKDRGDK